MLTAALGGPAAARGGDARAVVPLDDFAADDDAVGDRAELISKGESRAESRRKRHQSTRRHTAQRLSALSDAAGRSVTPLFPSHSDDSPSRSTLTQREKRASAKPKSRDDDHT